jgi:hypothetical protein
MRAHAGLAERVRGRSEQVVAGLTVENDVKAIALISAQSVAAVGVREVWRSTGRSLPFLHLQALGVYQSPPARAVFM